jgi:hypothetical protein
MISERTPQCSTHGAARRLVVASAIAVVVTAAFLPGAGFGSSAAVRGAQTKIPAGPADAIHARFGTEAIRSNSAAGAQYAPVFGVSVALSADGTTALVSAPGAHHNKGAAYVFRVSDAGAWSSSKTPVAALTHSATRAEIFGLKVALSADGTTAFVGAPYAGNGTGAIYVFHVSAEDAWTSTSTPTATLTVADSYRLGSWALAASTDGTTLVAGAPYDDDYHGGAYVFHVSSENAWLSSSTPTATLSEGGAALAGSAVAISGDGTTALLSDDYGDNAYGAFVYHVSAEDAWTSSSSPTATLSDSWIGTDQELGSDVALSGDGTVALLGAPDACAADVFRASGEAAWVSTSTPTATLSGVVGLPCNLIGVRVVLSSDGTTALVGAPGRKGAAYIFRVPEEEAWADSAEPTATLTNSGGALGDTLGSALAVSADGATALLGAPFARYWIGAADLFHVSDASSWTSSATPTAILTNSALNQCVVPQLTRLTVAAAKSALKARSCRLGTVKRVHATGKKGRVLSQSLKPWSRHPVGARVGVKVQK